MAQTTITNLAERSLRPQGRFLLFKEPQEENLQRYMVCGGASLPATLVYGLPLQTQTLAKRTHMHQATKVRRKLISLRWCCCSTSVAPVSAGVTVTTSS